MENVKTVKYRKGYRYQSVEAYQQDVAIEGIFPVKPGGNEFVHLTLDGELYIAAWYAWNGANKPAINDPTFVIPSMEHDALCQLWNLGIIDDAGRAAADKLLGKRLKQCTLIIAARQKWPLRWALTALAYTRPLWVEGAVSWYSERFAMRGPEPILTAP